MTSLSDRSRVVLAPAGAVLAAAILVSAAGSAGATADAAVPGSDPARTVRVDQNTSGQGFLAGSYEPSISGDGRLVAFTSSGDPHHPSTERGLSKVFVRDMATGVLRQLTPTNKEGFSPKISSDGHFLAYLTATGTVRVQNLVSGDEQVASVSTEGELVPNAHCRSVDISADGRYVVMECGNSLDPAVSEYEGIWLRDMTDHTTTNLTPPLRPNQRSARASSPSISDDGSVVAYSSATRQTAAPMPQGSSQIFVRDVAAATTQLVSQNNHGFTADGYNEEPTISGNGAAVVFTSTATDLAPQTAPADRSDVYVHDLASGRTSAISRSDCTDTCPEGGVERLDADISSSGRYVSFPSAGTYPSQVAPGGLNVYVLDRSTGVQREVSLNGDGRPLGTKASGSAAMEGELTASGQDVAFQRSPSYVVSDQIYDRRRWANGP